MTGGAYPSDTYEQISKYLALSSKQSEQIAAILDFALLCILEDVRLIPGKTDSIFAGTLEPDEE